MPVPSVVVDQIKISPRVPKSRLRRVEKRMATRKRKKSEHGRREFGVRVELSSE